MSGTRCGDTGLVETPRWGSVGFHLAAGKLVLSRMAIAAPITLDGRASVTLIRCQLSASVLDRLVIPDGAKVMIVNGAASLAIGTAELSLGANASLDIQGPITLLNDYVL